MEIVPKNSKAMDRITKPALYAQAGIPFYWRVETEGAIIVHTHRRDHDAEVYVSTGSFDKLITIDQPWPMEFPIAEITPRFYRPEPRD